VFEWAVFSALDPIARARALASSWPFFASGPAILSHLQGEVELAAAEAAAEAAATTAAAAAAAAASFGGGFGDAGAL